MELTVKQLQEKKRDLEADIVDCVDRLMEEFKAKTGCSPSGIYIKLENVTGLAMEPPQFVVAGCSVDINL